MKALLAAVSLASLSACGAGAGDRCERGADHCDGNVARRCQYLEADGDAKGYHWYDEDCAELECIEVTASGGEAAVVCALSNDLEPACVDLRASERVCVGDTLIECDHGYPVGETDCGADRCITSEPEPPVLPQGFCALSPEPTACCLENAVSYCTAGTRVKCFDGHPIESYADPDCPDDVPACEAE